MSKTAPIAPNPITHALIDSTVDRGLREIMEDPNRSIRKLTDLGRLFSKGRFTDEIYGLVQDLLHNDDSPYYTAIERMLRNADQSYLKNFGINLGYHGLNVGSKIIRSRKDKVAYHTPWILQMRFNASLPNSLTVSEIDSCIEQGKPLGIYTHSIRMEGNLQALDDLCNVMAKHRDCAFFFTLPDQKLMPAHLEAIRSCSATLFLLRTNYATALVNAETLRSGKAFYGTCTFYDNNTAASWIEGKRVKDLLPYETPFSILSPDDTCSAKTAQKVAKYCRSLRMHPEYPLLLFDQMGDAIAVDRLSNRRDTGSYFELLETGDIRTGKEILTDFRHTVSLEQLLTIALPKEKRHA